MARGYPGAFGGKQINSAGVWLGFCLLFLVGLADLRRPLSMRNLDLLVLLSFSRLALVLQPRRHLHQRAARLPADALPARANGLERVARAPRHRLGPGLADLGARGRDGVHGRLPHRPERPHLERDRRRLLGRGRREPDRERPVAVRALPGRGPAQGLRQGRRRRRDPGADPDQRAMRVRQPPGRHVRAGRLRGLPARLPDPRLDGEMGRPSGGAPELDHVRPALPAGAWRSSACASAGHDWPSRSPSPGSRTPSPSTSRTRTPTTRSRRSS